MTALLWILAGTAAAEGVAIVVMALRLAGAIERAGKEHAQLIEAENRRLVADKQLQVTAREYAESERRRLSQLGALQRDILDLEKDLEKCGDPDARRERLRRLLTKAAYRKNGGDEPQLRSDATAGPKPPAQ